MAASKQSLSSKRVPGVVKTNAQVLSTVLFLISTMAFADPTRDASLKELHPPCAYEYNITNRQNVATVIGGERLVHFIIPNDATTYSSEVSKHWSSKILIENGKYFWRYADDSVGEIWATGEVDLMGRTPEDYLCNLDFPHHDRSTLHREFEHALATAKIAGTHQKITDSEFGWSITDHSKLDQVILSYKAWSVLPDWSNKELSQFRLDFKNAVGVRVPSGKLNSLATLLDQIGEEFQITPIPLTQLESVAKKMKYHLPAVGEVTKASGAKIDGPAKELDLSVTYQGKSINLAQYSTRITIDKQHVKQTRRIDSWDIQVVQDPGTNALLTYMLNDTVTIITDGDRISDTVFVDIVLSLHIPQGGTD